MDAVLASQVGFLIAADDTYLTLYRKKGHLYRRTHLNLTTADTWAFNRDGFSLEREGAHTWLVYSDAGNSTARVEVP